MIQHTNKKLKSAKIVGVKDLVAYVDSKEGCLDLTIGEPNFHTEEAIKNAAIDALNNNITTYPPALGFEEARLAIQSYEKEAHGLSYQLDEILVTQGSTSGLASTLMAILNEGDEVIVPLPAYPLYTSIIEMLGARVIGLDLAQHDFLIDPAELEDAITAKTKAIILTSPNNPSGTVFTYENLQEIGAILEHHDIFIVVDEIYGRILYRDYYSIAQFPALFDKIIVIQSFSKIYAMTGWRLGYVLAERTILDEILKWHHNLLVGATSFIQKTIPVALSLDMSGVTESYRQRRDYVYDRLVAMGMEVVKPEGAFYIFPSVKKYGMDSVAFCKALAQQQKVLFVPGVYFGAENYVRICYCYEFNDLIDGMDRLESFIHTLSV